MTTIIPQFINNKVIFLSVIIAIILHGSLIIIINLIAIDTTEKLEPKIILELMNDVIEEIKPVINEIKPPQIIEPQEIIKPPVIQPPKEVLLEKIENIIISNDNPNLITIPRDLKPLINNKIDIPKPIKNNNTDLIISELPKIIQPEPIIKNKKPIKAIIQPNLPEKQELQNIENISPQQVQELPKKPVKAIIKPNLPGEKELQSIDNAPPQQVQELPKKPVKAIIKPNLPGEKELQSNDNTLLQQVQELPKKPIRQLDKADSIQNETKKSLTSEETSELNTYKNKIRNIIQSFAINSYPLKEKRRKIEGKVHIIIKLRLDGSIEYIKSGPNTNASEALIKSAIESVKKSAPFEKVELLEIKNEFSINIIYKINR
jgi:outer membrane biosynthesis protein TonB